jgi:adenine phosphoribosyltransferase
MSLKLVEHAQELSAYIRSIPDYPKPGIVFRDITTLLSHPTALQSAIHFMSAPFINAGITHVAGTEARGFLFGPAIACKLNAGFVPIRKKGKLPSSTYRMNYDLEYGQDTLEIHTDALESGNRVLLVDDLLATGGTIQAAQKLVNLAEAEVVGAVFLIELSFLNGRSMIPDLQVHSLIQYTSEE